MRFQRTRAILRKIDSDDPAFNGGNKIERRWK
jgi:hypothetical protein